MKKEFLTALAVAMTAGLSFGLAGTAQAQEGGGIASGGIAPDSSLRVGNNCESSVGTGFTVNRKPSTQLRVGAANKGLRAGIRVGNGKALALGGSTVGNGKALTFGTSVENGFAGDGGSSTGIFLAGGKESHGFDSGGSDIHGFFGGIDSGGG